MYALNEQQIDFILNDIKIRGVEMEDLQLNLLDHICCIIEYELEQEGDFKNFYHKTISKFFKKELKEIEEETKLLLTFKHYYAMKKTMNTVGIIASIGIVLGSIFRFQHWPGANVMLLLGVILISFVFLPLMFTLKLRESTEKRDRTILIIGCVVSILLIIAAAFKLMHWPGGNILVGLGMVSLLLIFVPVYLSTGLRNPAAKVNTIVNAILIIAGSGLFMSLSTNSGISRGTADGIIKVHERLLENIEKTKLHNEALYNTVQTSLPADAKSYLAESTAAQNYLKNLKINLIMCSERVPAEVAEKLTINNMNNIGNEMAPTFFMLGPANDGDGGHTGELKTKLASLSASLSKVKDAEKNKWNLNITIDNKDFEHVPLGLVLQEFAELQYEIENANAQVLNYYSAKL